MAGRGRKPGSKNKPKSACPAGHDLTIPENVYLKRVCRECSRSKVQAHREQKANHAR